LSRAPMSRLYQKLCLKIRWCLRSGAHSRKNVSFSSFCLFLLSPPSSAFIYLLICRVMGTTVWWKNTFMFGLERTFFVDNSSLPFVWIPQWPLFLFGQGRISFPRLTGKRGVSSRGSRFPSSRWTLKGWIRIPLLLMLPFGRGLAMTFLKARSS